MPRSIRSFDLETRTNRLKLPVAKKPVFVRIGPQISLGYRRNMTAGTWVLRVADGKGGNSTKAIGFADDYEESNGQTFLTFFEAQEKARKVHSDPSLVKALTVQEATDNYLTVLKAKNARTAYDTRLRLEKHFLPKFKEKLVSELTKTQLDTWLSSLVSKSDDSEKVRKSKDTANRVLAMVKAIFNFAMADASHGLNDNAWRHIKAFKSVSKPRQIRYTNEEVAKIIASAPDNATRNLIKAAFLTGTRYGEIVSSRVASVDLNGRTWTVSGKTGSRAILLQQSAVEFFKGLIEGRKPDDYLFTMENGERWKASDQTRPFKAALSKAGLSEDGNLYSLRHTYISVSIEGNIPLTVIADNCGTSVLMINKTYAKVLNEKKRAFIETGTPSL